ncbi:MAG: hypothetical protein LBS42_03790 [Tannerella sp.]|jgi:hypothetical protein|nr:hypothetical protein [Tannerella sp.]
MKHKLNFFVQARMRIRPGKDGWMAFRCVMILAAAFLIAAKANAVQVGIPAGGTTLTAGTAVSISSSTSFPLKILANGTYTIEGNYCGDYGSPSGYAGTKITVAQSAERKTPWTNAASTNLLLIGTENHGIYVGAGLKNVTVILRNVGILTQGVNNAAFIIDGVDANNGTSDFQNKPDGSNVVVRLEGKNMLYSGNIVACNRAGLEVWKGSSVYIEGDGSLLAKSSTTRNYYANSSPRLATHAHPQGSPYWNTDGDASIRESVQSYNNGGRSGAAGIGAGDVGGSGGNVIIRGNPVVIAIAASHGAGIGGAWGTAGIYRADVLIYGGTVESWGGQHGAGIGGGCAGGNGSIVILPVANVYSASYDPGRPMLGQMTNVIYFGNPDDSRLALYTEDYREVDMFLDMSKNAAVRSVIERLGGGMNPSYLPLGKTKNNWPAGDNAYGQHRPNYTDWAATTSPVIAQGADKHVLLLNGGFVPSSMNVAFLTSAKTEKNHSYAPVATMSNATGYVCFLTGGITTYGLNYPPLDTYYNSDSPAASHYATGSAVSRPVPRFVMIAPTYTPSVQLVPDTPPELTAGYAETNSNNKITLTIGNTGNQKLYNPRITIIGDDYELISSPGTPLQTAVDTALAGKLASDAGKFYIPVGVTFDIVLRLKAGKNPGTSYDGWILFSADNLPDAPTPKQFNINVLDKFLLPPDLTMETPADTVVSGPFRIRAKFKSQTGVYPYGVKDLVTDDIFVDYGVVTAVTPVPSTESPAGYFSDWIIDITPASSLPDRTSISIFVKQDAAEDPRGANTRTVSNPKLVTFSSGGPYVVFSVAEGEALPSLDTVLVYINGNGIIPGKEDSVYVSGRPFTATGGLSSLQTNFHLTRLPSTSLDIGTPGQYQLTVVDRNNLKIGSPAPAGFPNGDYELDIPAGYIHNYDGNSLSNTKLHFSVRTPDIPDGAGLGGAIVPSTLDAAGGPVRIWVYGRHLSAAKGRLAIVFRNAIPGYAVDQEVYVPSVQFTDTTAYVDVVLPPNMSVSSQAYDFTIRLIGRLPLTDVTPDLTATVSPATAIIDTTQTALGYREGLHAWPHTQTFEGGTVDLKLVGENLFHLNSVFGNNPLIRVKKDGAYMSAVIPVVPPMTLGDVVIPLGKAFTTEKNLSASPAVYVFELWYDVDGTPTPVPEYSSELPFVADSTTVKSAVDDLIQTVKNTHHVVSQRVANTLPSVRTWLVPQLNAIEVLRNFDLTVSEGDITFTDFDSAIEGTGGAPQGSNGHFVFTLKLHTVPAQEVTLNTGEIIAERMPAAVLERKVTMPEAEGYVTDPPVGIHHIESGRDFTFYLVPVSDETRLLVPKVTTNRRIGSDAESVTVEPRDDGAYYFVTVRRIQESISIYINGKTPDANEKIAAAKAWGEKGKLHIRAAEPGIATVYNAPGAQIAVVSLKEGETMAMPLPAGIYIVSFHGAAYKAFVK